HRAAPSRRTRPPTPRRSMARRRARPRRAWDPSSAQEVESYQAPHLPPVRKRDRVECAFPGLLQPTRRQLRPERDRAADEERAIGDPTGATNGDPLPEDAARPGRGPPRGPDPFPEPAFPHDHDELGRLVEG